ncbi:hypothetical protein ABG067_002709 [Albugo candida]
MASKRGLFIYIGSRRLWVDYVPVTSAILTEIRDFKLEEDLLLPEIKLGESIYRDQKIRICLGIAVTGLPEEVYEEVLAKIKWRGYDITEGDDQQIDPNEFVLTIPGNSSILTIIQPAQRYIVNLSRKEDNQGRR